ncbi:hypothetical protein Aoki45_14670 [Algoriphagus sp. oki45]|uniref:hypothetical protein n=1 Tax=Algoriphagus sp. oki45 TaxID=3067294 RepID=UPI0027FC7B7B|nr:hypothetical protein Aoki45_14670 [Algoriphagus sp. oki45]
MEIDPIRKVYKRTERFTLIVLMIALPVFGLVYLYHTSGSINKDLPPLGGFLNGFLIAFSATLLIGQYLVFHSKIKTTFSEEDLLAKVKIYSKATEQRFLFLFLVSICTSVGLLFGGNPLHTILFALALVFFSLAKPSPDRMARLMKLKKEDRELIRAASRPE